MPAALFFRLKFEVCSAVWYDEEKRKAKKARNKKSKNKAKKTK